MYIDSIGLLLLSVYPCVRVFRVYLCASCPGVRLSHLFCARYVGGEREEWAGCGLVWVLSRGWVRGCCSQLVAGCQRCFCMHAHTFRNSSTSCACSGHDRPSSRSVHACAPGSASVMWSSLFRNGQPSQTHRLTHSPTHSRTCSLTEIHAHSLPSGRDRGQWRPNRSTFLPKYKLPTLCT